MSIINQALSASQIDGEAVEIRFVPLSILRLQNDLWQGNAKRHDISKILKSIENSGYIDPGKWDSKINQGRGGIIFGNGRTKAIVQALIQAREQGQEPPRGIPKSKETGEWCVPVKFGVDSVSESAAIALAIDHNNLTMAGGDFDVKDIAKMWDESYVDLLRSIADEDVLPVSVGADDLADLLLSVSAIGSDVYDEGDREELKEQIDEVEWGDAIGKIPEGDREPFQSMTFTLHDDQADVVKDALKLAISEGAFFEVNQNSNGNALYRICARFLHADS
jgi:hypothetical protein